MRKNHGHSLGSRNIETPTMRQLEVVCKIIPMAFLTAMILLKTDPDRGIIRAQCTVLIYNLP